MVVMRSVGWVPMGGGWTAAMAVVTTPWGSSATDRSFTYGATLDQAYERTAQLEWLCCLWLTASAVPGHRPALLTPAQLDEVTEALKGYGQPGLSTPAPGPGQDRRRPRVCSPPHRTARAAGTAPPAPRH
ncbi:hypothetical protein SMICM17S_00061 [Streptomyces microflavus]